jgi:hypothetical protein
MTTDIRRLKEVHLKPTREKSALLIRLVFRSSELPISNIEFELESSDAMALLSALQATQRKTGWRLPQYFQKRGKPTLKVVPKES